MFTLIANLINNCHMFTMVLLVLLETSESKENFIRTMYLTNFSVYACWFKIEFNPGLYFFP